MTTIEPPRDLSTHVFFSGESAYVGEADYEGGVGKGSGSAWSGRFQLGIVRPLSGLRLLDGNGGQWQLRLGMDYERFEFNHTGAFPLPASLQRIAAVLALEYRIGRQVGVIIDARPGVHFENRIASNAWNCPVLFGIGFPVTDRFTLALESDCRWPGVHLENQRPPHPHGHPARAAPYVGRQRGSHVVAQRRIGRRRIPHG